MKTIGRFPCGCVFKQDAAGDGHLHPCRDGCPTIQKVIEAAEGAQIKRCAVCEALPGNHSCEDHPEALN